MGRITIVQVKKILNSFINSLRPDLLSESFYSTFVHFGMMTISMLMGFVFMLVSPITLFLIIFCI